MAPAGAPNLGWMREICSRAPVRRALRMASAKPTLAVAAVIREALDAER
jgi:hypothetical protein